MLAEPSLVQSALATCPLSEHPPEICRAAEPAADPEAEQPAEQKPPAVFTQEQLPPPPPKMLPPPPPKMLLDIWAWASGNCEAAGAQASSTAGVQGIEPSDNYSVSELVCKEDVWQYVRRHVSEYVHACKEAQWHEEPVPRFYKDLTDGEEFLWTHFMQKYAPETFEQQRVRRFGICWLLARRCPGFHVVLDTYEMIAPTEGGDRRPWFKLREKQEEVFEG